MIERKTGRILLEGLVVGPQTTRTQFLKVAPDAEQWVVSQQGDSWRVLRNQWVLVVGFVGESVEQARLVWNGPLGVRATDGENEEVQRDRIHRRALRRWHGGFRLRAKIDEAWGDARPFIDPRSNSYIRVRWLRPSRPVLG